MQLTVIIPIYNRAKMLFHALESLQWQTYKDFVIVICDDASKENLKEVVAQFPNLNIEYHYYEANAGQFKNAMRGVNLCKTPLMKFLYSDDLLFPKALERQVKALQEAPDAAVCLGGIAEFEELAEQNTINLLNYSKAYIPQPRNEKQWARLEEYSGFVPSACMYRTEFFRNIGGFNTGLRGIADWEIYVALSSHYPVVAVDEPVCAMRFHADQVVKKYCLGSDALLIKDVFWMTSNANPYRTRLGLPWSQQLFLRQDICWRDLRISLSSEYRLSLLKKWLDIVAQNNMLLPFIIGFPVFLVLKILRKPKVQTRILNLEKYKDMIRSILLQTKTKNVEEVILDC